MTSHTHPGSPARSTIDDDTTEAEIETADEHLRIDDGELKDEDLIRQARIQGRLPPPPS